jgi:hypothetical protein
MMDVALFFGKPVVNHWVGTDVTNAVEDHRKGLVSVYTGRVKELCEVSWIQQELMEIGIHAEVVPLLGLEYTASYLKKMPDVFRVLLYVGKNRPVFYGMDTFVGVAREFNDVEFLIVGNENFSMALPDNMKVLGWVHDMNRVYSEASVYIRFPQPVKG